MSRVSKIKYNPNLSVEENAKLNGVQVSGIRTYLQVHGIDRRRDGKLVFINAIKEYLKEHPKSSKYAVSQNVFVNGKPISIQTVRKYWEYATGEKGLPEYNPQKIDKQYEKHKAVLSRIPLDSIKKFLSEQEGINMISNASL